MCNSQPKKGLKKTLRAILPILMPQPDGGEESGLTKINKKSHFQSGMIGQV